MSNIYNQLKNKIKKRTAKICIVGLGYVGLPLAFAFAKKYKVIGFDVIPEKINQLAKGKSYIPDAPSSKLKKILNKKFFPTFEEEQIREADIIIMAVPTPLDEAKKPDLDFVKKACGIVSRNLQKGQLVILESTTYPGTTNEVMIPILEKSGLQIGRDFLVAYSPERVDPGNKVWTVENTPKVVGGYDGKTGEIAQTLYQSAINAKIVKVSGCKEAEATKFLENTFREINIALVNELSLMFEKLGINIWEVIEAAKSKPHSFMAHYPGPGIGGHCIPLDPYYLLYEAEKIESYSRFIELAGTVNDHMRIHTINLAREGMQEKNKKLGYDTTVTVLGISYKKDIEDVRESPSITIIEELIKLGATVKVYDPYVTSVKTKLGELASEPDFYQAVKNSDALIFVTDHNKFKKIDWNKTKGLMRTPVIVDGRNMFDENKLKGFVYRGIGKPIK
ncbi:nucleotide sugar dehydrogenase [Candidatus Woesearchaeota archaeon]|nr:nucleotide sugar dehydrogenase [Candidatus Woesearchaeota archaeon]